MSISKLNGRLLASIAGYLQEPQSFEQACTRSRTALDEFMYPRLNSLYEKIPGLKTFISGFSGMESLRGRVSAISCSVISQARGIFLGEAILHSMGLSRASILHPEQLLELCKWITTQQDHNLLLFFDRLCDVSPAASAFLPSVNGEQRERAKQVWTWLESNLPVLQTITTLNLDRCELTQLPDAITLFSNLKELFMNSNWLVSLPHPLGQLKKLELLSADSNAITRVSPALCDLPSLTCLSLNGNQMSRIPAAVYNMPQLAQLNFEDNGLTELSPEIGRMKGLVRLYLSNNQLKELPPQIGDLPNLAMFYACENRLTYLCGALARLPELIWLRVDENPIQAVCPTLKTALNPVVSDNETIKGAPSKKQ